MTLWSCVMKVILHNCDEIDFSRFQFDFTSSCFSCLDYLIFLCYSSTLFFFWFDFFSNTIEWNQSDYFYCVFLTWSEGPEHIYAALNIILRLVVWSVLQDHSLLTDDYYDFTAFYWIQLVSVSFSLLIFLGSSFFRIHLFFSEADT